MVAKLTADMEREPEFGRGDTGDPDNPTVGRPRHEARIIVDAHPTEAQQLTLNKLMQLFDEARQHKRPMIARWKKAYRMIRNQFWDAASRPNWMPSPQIPEMWPIIDALVAWEGDQSPEYTISPQALPHTEYQRFFASMADDLEVVLNASYTVNEEELEWAIVNWDKYVYGTGITKTTWDMTLAGGLGDAITKRVDPFAFYPDPSATNMKDANYFVEGRRMSIQELDRRWPGSGKLFPQGGVDHDVDVAPTRLDQGTSGRPPLGNPGAIAPATSPRYGMPGGARFSVNDPSVPGVTVLEFWIREHEQYNATDTQTGEATTRVFDAWRVVVVAGDHIIMDEPAENLWSHGGHPYDRVVRRDTGEFWGDSLVELMSSGQAAYNRILAALQQNVELVGNPMFKDATGNQRTTITNKPGTRLPAQGPGDTASGWLQPPRIDQAAPNLMTHHLNRMENLAGLTAVMKGNSPSGRNAQGVVDAMQEAGFVRIRSSLKWLEAAMRSAGTKKADLIAENYTSPRLVSIAGPGGERTSRALSARRFLVPTEKGASPLRFQLKIDVGSSKHTSRQMREDRSITMYTLGLIDRDAALSDLDYPNAQVVAERVDKKEQELAQAGEQMGPGSRQRARA